MAPTDGGLTMNTITHQHQHDDFSYDSLLESIRSHFAGVVGAGRPLFRTDVPPAALWGLFLGTLPSEDRQHHNCHACRRFIESFGGLVAIDVDGTIAPAMWGEGPGVYSRAFETLRLEVVHSKAVGMFLSSSSTWGEPVTNAGRRPGPWRHMSVTPPPAMLARHALKTSGQLMAEKIEEAGMLARGLEEFPASVVAQALVLLESEVLYRAEKVIGPARWLSELHARLATTKHERKRENMIHLATATAPPGFCHVRSTMIGTLLEDLASGLLVEDVRARFAAKMHPLLYQRPQAPPSAGNIAQAEKIVADLGIAPSLERRFARLEEIEAIWRPLATKTAQGPDLSSVFGHLKPREQREEEPARLALPATTMTWVKFRDTVLPEVQSLEYLVTHGRAPFAALTTAVHPDAPPILQWDSPERRNPSAWFLYHGGSTPSRWHLVPGYVRVTAASLLPTQWFGGQHQHHAEGVLFVLEGCRDVDSSEDARRGNALFPEQMRGELHQVRRTIEEFSSHASLSGEAEASACGIMLQKGSPHVAMVFRVTSGSSVRTVAIDRWD
jgi:hypothetical protein